MAGYAVFKAGELPFEPRSPDREVARLSDALQEMRANVFRLAPGARGTRHLEQVQEEVFVVLDGTITLLLGDPAEAVELPAGSVAAVPPQTVLQVTNPGDADALVFVVGAPPVADRAVKLE